MGFKLKKYIFPALILGLYITSCSSTKEIPAEIKLQKLLSETVDNEEIFGVVATVEKGDNSFSWTGSAGNLTAEKPYFIASTTKLYITAVLLKLRSEGKISLDDKISKYLRPEALFGLHVLNGVEYSDSITIGQLMAQTSGLPDYFEQEKTDGTSLVKELSAGKDQSWTIETVLAESKKMSPHFKPGEKGKAFYSDTNYQLLGKIIENVTGLPIKTVFSEFLFKPLNLKQTYLYSDSSDTLPANLYFENRELNIPKAMVSFGPDGGIVSTSTETMIFLRAFFSGKFFPAKDLKDIQQWNDIFFPLEYGIGISRFKLPWFFSPFSPIPEIMGHSGLSGAFAFYCPEKDLYMTGTVNQVASPDESFKLMIKIMGEF
ncbi:MAG: beta-lactamase family protein [Bacteroidetes bacterium]|nr:beta-lactamase family protein [Bacteroidota bacterium]